MPVPAAGREDLRGGRVLVARPVSTATCAPSPSRTRTPREMCASGWPGSATGTAGPGPARRPKPWRYPSTFCGSSSSLVRLVSAADPPTVVVLGVELPMLHFTLGLPLEHRREHKVDRHAGIRARLIQLGCGVHRKGEPHAVLVLASVDVRPKGSDLRQSGVVRALVLLSGVVVAIDEVGLEVLARDMLRRTEVRLGRPVVEEEADGGCTKAQQRDEAQPDHEELTYRPPSPSACLTRPLGRTERQGRALRIPAGSTLSGRIRPGRGVLRLRTLHTPRVSKPARISPSLTAPHLDDDDHEESKTHSRRHERPPGTVDNPVCAGPTSFARAGIPSSGGR